MKQARIEAEGEAEAEVLKAKGLAEAELIRAEASKKAADLLAQNTVNLSFQIGHEQSTLESIYLQS